MALVLPFPRLTPSSLDSARWSLSCARSHYARVCRGRIVDPDNWFGYQAAVEGVREAEERVKALGGGV